MMNIEQLSEVIRMHRKKSGLTQKGLADLAGVGKTVIYDIEKGKETIQLDTIKKILSMLNIKIKFESPLMKLMEASNHAGGINEKS
jgi:y4mF family transcriptional regulator